MNENELSERAQWYLDNWTPEQVAEFAAAQEQEVVALTAGAEVYDDERVVPTPGQWIMLFNRATPEKRLAKAAQVLELQDRLGRVQQVLAFHGDRPGFREAMYAALTGSPVPEVRVSVDTPSFDSDETTLTVRYAGSNTVKVPTCPSCRDADHYGITCEANAQLRVGIREFWAREVERAVDEAKRGPLLAVSSEDVAGALLGRYAEQVNAPLRPETIAALGEALRDGTAPRRLMVRKQGWWVKGCAVCRQLVEYCECPDGEGAS